MFNKIANATITDPVFSIQDWEKLHGTASFGHKSAAISKFAGNTSKYLLSHVTIMSSVMTEADPHDYLIKPECSYLVNNNEDAWENDVLRLSYRSFVGAFNFYEHYQNSKAAKGHILDSVLRKIHIAPDVWVYFVDLLVATDLSHEDLVSKIRNEEVRYLSMGCVTDLVICSFCGKQVADQNSYCTHLHYNKGQFLPDEDGIARRIAELCGHKSLPNGGVRFVEASWVAVPAFPGATLRTIVADTWEGPKTAFTKDAELINKAASSQRRVTDIQLISDLYRKLK
jgi:hypothetical protein